MTTATRTPKTSKVVIVPVAPAAEQQGKAVDAAAPAAVPWSQLAPSDYVVLTRMFGLRVRDEERPAAVTAPATPGGAFWIGLDAPHAAALGFQPQLAYAEAGFEAGPTLDEKELTKAALLAAVLALVETGVADLTIEETQHFFGLFGSRTAEVAKGHFKQSWPEGSIESNLQGRLSGTPVKVRDLVAGWIGAEQENPWKVMRDRIVNRLVRQGTVERHKEKRSFLFFSWEDTVHDLAVRTPEALAEYGRVARKVGRGLSLWDNSPLTLSQGDVILGEIDKGFAARTEQTYDD